MARRPETNQTRRNRRRTAALAMLGALALAGCTHTREEPTAAIPTDYRLRHPIGIKEKERTLAVLVGAKWGALTSMQRREIAELAHGWREGGTGGVIIAPPLGTTNERAARRAVRDIMHVLAAAGVPGQAISVRPYQSGPETLAPVKVAYARLAAEAGPCGLWPNDLGPSMNRDYFENRPYWNLGCASQRNLAAMVDNPTDLVQPRAEDAVFAERRAVAVERYRSGNSPATTYPNPDRGTISTVGK